MKIRTVILANSTICLLANFNWHPAKKYQWQAWIISLEVFQDFILYKPITNNSSFIRPARINYCWGNTRKPSECPIITKLFVFIIQHHIWHTKLLCYLVFRKLYNLYFFIFFLVIIANYNYFFAIIII